MHIALFKGLLNCPEWIHNTTFNHAVLYIPCMSGLQKHTRVGDSSVWKLYLLWNCLNHQINNSTQTWLIKDTQLKVSVFW